MSQSQTMQHLDSLFAHVASVAAQRNIPYLHHQLPTDLMPK